MVRLDREEVQNIILMIIGELKRQGMLKDTYSVILKDLEPVIKKFFHTKKNKQIERFLREYSDDPYIDIIYLHYRDAITIDQIAGILQKDVSTIKRNKKRLIMQLYDFMEGGQ